MNNKLLQSIKDINNNSSIPTIIVDTNLNYIWENIEMEEYYGIYTSDDKDILFLDNIDKEEIMYKIRHGRYVQIKDIKSINFFDTDIVINPVIDYSINDKEYKVEYAIITFTNEIDNKELVEKAIIGFDVQMREPISEIFIATDAMRSKNVNDSIKSQYNQHIESISNQAYKIFRS